jgi:hypothetical protein
MAGAQATFLVRKTRVVNMSDVRAAQFAYWAGRYDDAAVIARTTACLYRLADAHPALAQWSGAYPGAPVWAPGAGSSAVEAAVRRAKEPEDPSPGGVLFSMDAVEISRTSLKITNTPGARIDRNPSSAILRLPSAAHATDLYHAPTMGAIFKAIVESWEPDWAVCTTDDIQEAQTGHGVLLYPRHVGWFTYFSGAWQIPSAVADGVSVEDLSTGVVIAVDGPLQDVTSERVVRVRIELEALGLIEPADSQGRRMSEEEAREALRRAQRR